jgi:hypothetical protein
MPPRVRSSGGSRNCARAGQSCEQTRQSRPLNGRTTFTDPLMKRYRRGVHWNVCPRVRRHGRNCHRSREQRRDLASRHRADVRVDCDDNDLLLWRCERRALQSCGDNGVRRRAPACVARSARLRERASAASGLLRFLFPGNATLGATLPVGAARQSFVLEVVLTFLLMLVILSVSTGVKEKGITAGIAIGGVIALDAMFAGRSAVHR